MRLPLQFLLLILLLASLLAGGFLWLSFVRMDAYFRHHESAEMTSRMLLARRALSNEVRRVEAICSDWANWSDLYRYAKGENAGFIVKENPSGCLRYLKLNYLLILDPGKKVLYETAVCGSGMVVPAPPEFCARFLYAGYADRVLAGDQVSGYLSLSGRVFAFCAMPARASDGLGATAGVVLMASELAGNLDQRLSTELGPYFSILPFHEQSWYDPTEVPVDLAAEGVVPLVTAGPDSVLATLLIGDISGKPAFVLLCRYPREVFKEGRILWRGFFADTVVVSLVCGVLFGGAIWVFYLRRIHRLVRRFAGSCPSNAAGKGVLAAWRVNELTSLECAVGDLFENCDRLREECAHANKRLRHFFDQSPDAIILVDLETRRVFSANPAAENLFGRATHDLVGQLYEEILATDGRYRYLLDHQIRQDFFCDELSVQKASGETVPVRMTATTVRTGQAGALQVVVHDLSGVRQAEQTMLRTSSEAEEIIRRKNEFLSHVSHELRTPLSAIIGFTELANEARDLGEAKSLSRGIRRESAHLLELVNDLLDDAKIEAGKVLISPEPSDLPQFLADIAASTKALINKKPLRFVLDLNEAAQRWYRVDRLRLRQILMNLLSNAIKFTQRGSVTLRVGLEGAPGSEQDGYDRVCFSVSDTGIGISADAQEKIFESYTQADGSISRDYGGTGLGTTISRKLVHLMGGSIELQSAPGQGAEFRFSLLLQQCQPLAGLNDVNAVTPAQTEGAPVAAAQDMNASGVCECPVADILLVEDYALNRQVESAYVRAAGHRLHVAKTGREAVDLCAATRFDLILMDIQLPEMDGYQATRALRAEGPNTKTPVYGLTAYADGKTTDLCLEAGMHGVLAKPFTKDEFFALLERTVGVIRRTQGADDGLRRENAEQLPREDIVKHFFFGKRELAEKALDMFLRDAQGMFASISAGIEGDDTAVVGKYTHQLKSGAGYLGLGLLQDYCQRMNDLATAGETDELNKLLRETLAEFNRVKTLRQSQRGS